MRKRAIVITGPTASGKSALAIDIAQRLGTEIISADSRQIFSGIPIVTAAPTAEELAMVKHHLVGTLPLDAYYSAAMFEEDALDITERIFRTHDEVVICGGSMMYIDAFCKGIDNLPTVPDNIRKELGEEHAEKGDEWLLSELRSLDPEYWEKVDRHNIRRIFHAVEIIRTAGCSYTSLRKGEVRRRDFMIEKHIIEMPRQELFTRINSRVDRMIADGLEDEARKVYPLRGLNSLNTVGLKEMFAWFDGEMDRHTAIERIKKNTRVYAKKQMTWLKNSW